MSALDQIPEEKSPARNTIRVHNFRAPCTVNKRKTLHPLINSMPIMTMPDRPKQVNRGITDKNLSKRLLSAKEHKLKQIQNQLNDAHFHINELTRENGLLRNLQKRLDSALQRYEGVNGEIPNIMHKHSEEIRSWQVRYKQMRRQLSSTTQKLKEKDSEYLQLKENYKRLIVLSKNENLGEREKLQNQVSDLSDKIIKQNETINTLQRKLSLETKSYKHQLSVESMKRKEIQMQLNESNAHNERLTALLEKKEKLLTSNMMRRNFGKNRMTASNAFINNLSLPIKEYVDSEDSAGYSSKLDGSSGSTTFVLNDKIPTDDAISQNDNYDIAKDRSYKSDNADKSTDKSESTRFPEIKTNDDDLLTSDNQFPFNDPETDDLNKKMASFNVNNLYDTIDELEKEASKERRLMQDMLNGYCSQVIEHVGTATPNDLLNKAPKKKGPEVNNNMHLTKTTVSKLADDKKKSLLAKLNAIDRGEDDGLAIDNLKLPKTLKVNSKTKTKKI